MNENPLSETIWTDLAVGVPAVLGALCFLTAMVAVNRVRDALGRTNTMSVATGLGMVFFILAAFARVTVGHGFTWVNLGEVFIAIFATFFVVTIASMTIARAVFMSDTPLDPDTDTRDLDG